MSFPKYPKYKASGVEWLGDVPEHWEALTLRRCLLEHRQGYYTTDGYVDSGVKLLRITDLRDFGDIEFSECPRVQSRQELEPFLLRTSDFVFARTGGAGTFGLIGQLTEPIAYASYLIRFRFSEAALPRFLRHYFLSANFQNAVRQNIHGGVNQNVHAEDIKNQYVALPPRDEQTMIAAFLDRETSKIDGLVGEQRRLIELLKEKRQAVISHAVTKGLNPHAPLKPSGIEWLGDVPEHWETRTIAKASSKITNGFVGPTRDILVESGTPYIQATHIKKGRVNFNDGYFVTPDWSKSHAKSILAEGDVLIVQTGAGTGDVGLVSCNEVGFNCHALIIVTCLEELLSGAFLAAVLQSDFGHQKLESIQTGGMHPHLNCGNVKYVEVPVPPKNEQAEIVAHINEMAASFGALTAEAERGIDLLQERRTALISAAVTGKIDVRDVGLSPSNGGHSA